MDQQIITYAIGLFLVVVLAVSYIRHKRGGEEEAEPAVNIRQTMAEMRDYLGAPKAKEDSLASAFDLAPMQILSDMKKPTSGKKPVRDKEGE